MTARIDVLIPTCGRAAALAVTLTSLCAQTLRDFRVVISDQTEGGDSFAELPVQAALRLLRLHGHAVETWHHLPRRGLAEQRQFLLDRVQAPYVLYLDDDVMLEPDAIALLERAITEERCGFVGQAVIGLSFLDDVRPHEQTIEFWDSGVEPEIVRPDTPAWERHRLHNAANLYHVQQRLCVSAEHYRPYRIAWVGGCVLYDAAKLRAIGGFGFWRHLPDGHCGEDVLAQLRVMARYGGCGIVPSLAYHQELPTTLHDRRIDAPRVLGIEPEIAYGAH
jgi:GT2 family glycosyltransferase